MGAKGGFLAVIWLSHDHLSAIIEGAASPDVHYCVIWFQPEGHCKRNSKFGSLNPVEHLVEFEPGTFWSQRLNPI